LRNAKAMSDPAWFVYLFELADCSAFKVGFSCKPLQRIHTFSRRYFERFDLGQSLLLQLRTESEARAIEATLKHELAVFRTDSPAWVPLEAGGQTEWFGAVHFPHAGERLRSFVDDAGESFVLDTTDYMRGELELMSGSFEPWAWSQAQQVCDASASPYTTHAALALADSLRDWLDAYRYFDLPLYADDPAVFTFVTNTARLRA
jgi:hypothetical protein